MRIDAIAIGNNPPDDVNVIIEVPVGGEPIKYEMDKEAGTLSLEAYLGLYEATKDPKWLARAALRSHAGNEGGSGGGGCARRQNNRTRISRPIVSPVDLWRFT